MIQIRQRSLCKALNRDWLDLFVYANFFKNFRDVDSEAAAAALDVVNESISICTENSSFGTKKKQNIRKFLILITSLNDHTIPSQVNDWKKKIFSY